MITKEAREAAYQRLLADGRKRVGPPPTFEEVEALLRGELPEEKAERVRDGLAHYPELLRILTETFPTEDEAAGVLTEEQLAADLAAIRERTRRVVEPAIAPVVPFRRRMQPWGAAAGVLLAIAIGALAVRRLTIDPRPHETVVLYADSSRGGPSETPGWPSKAAVRLNTSTDYTLQPAYTGRRQYPAYRIDLVDLNIDPPGRVWSKDEVERQSNGTFPVEIETDGLRPGLYRLVLYGMDGEAERLAEYTLRFAPP